LQKTHAAFSDYACPFGGEEIFCSVTPADVEAERIALPPDFFAPSERVGGLPRLEGLAAFRKIAEGLLRKRVLLIHASAVSLEGGAYLFIAPSGGGKSTHRRFWQECFCGAEVISDDKPFVDMAAEPVVYGSPFGGKEGLQRNISAPLCGIAVIIKSAENRAVRLSVKEAIPRIVAQIYMPKDIAGRKVALALAVRLARVPVYAVYCTRTAKAAHMCRSALCGGAL